MGWLGVLGRVRKVPLVPPNKLTLLPHQTSRTLPKNAEIGEELSVAEQTIKQCYKIFVRHAKELVEGVESEFLKDGHSLDELPPV